MKLAIVGSRDFANYELFQQAIYARFCRYSSSWGAYIPVFDEVISGGARGADKMAARWAQEYNEKKLSPIKLTEFLPDWSLGKHAGYLRNEQIIHAADEVLAFWDGLSKGSAHSLSLAKKAKKPTMIIYF